MSEGFEQSENDMTHYVEWEERQLYKEWRARHGYSYRLRSNKRKKLKIANLKERYNTNKSAKVGETIICPCCGKEMVKKTYQQKFCSTRCKDNYWNTIR